MPPDAISLGIVAAAHRVTSCEPPALEPLQATRQSGVAISFVVPVRNEAPFIASTLESLLHQDYDPAQFEIIVVDGCSTDGTPNIVSNLMAAFPNLRLLHNPRMRSSAARNIGVRHSRGDLIVIVDGHCEIEGSNFLSNVVDAFRRSQADCLGRPQPLDVTGASALQNAIAAARSSPLGHHPASYIYSSTEQFVEAKSVGAAYRRAVFDVVGFFDESFDACEDVEFNHRVDRAGLKCFFTPAVQVRYHPRASLRGLFRQMVRYGRGRVRLFARHRETLSPLTLVPLAFVVGLVAGSALSWISPLVAAVYLVTLAIYVLAVFGEALRVTHQPGRLKLVPWLVLVFPTIHVGAGYGMLAELPASLFRWFKLAWSGDDPPVPSISPVAPASSHSMMQPTD